MRSITILLDGHTIAVATNRGMEIHLNIISESQTKLKERNS